jgi:hypothetical protein
MGLMAWIGKGALGFLKLIAFPFAKLASPRVRPFVRWTLHVLCVVAILGCLTWLNAALHLNQVVRAPSSLLRAAWLPLLFALIYSLAWIAWWLWRVATNPGEASPYPQLDEAWREGLEALAQAKIDLQEAPVYLLVGGAAERIDGLVRATGWTWDVPLTPKRPNSALRMCATRDAVFIDLSNACASGLYTTRLFDRPVRAMTAAPVAEASFAVADEHTGGGVATMTVTQRTAQRGLDLIEQSLALLESETEGEAATSSHQDGVRIDEEELQAAEQRLAHVCRLLADERAPFCPANGALALVSWETTSTQAVCNRAAVLLDRDLQTIQAELSVALPRLAIITDIETARGGKELVARIPADQRQRRFGVRLPRLSPTEVASWPRVLEESLQWLTRELVPALGYRLLKSGAPEDTATWRGNASIFEFLDVVRLREARLLRLLQRGVVPSLGQASLGGVFFAANATEEPAQQAFLAGVMPQVLEMQNEVAWTAPAIASNARAWRWTLIGYGLLTAVLVGFLAAAILA